VYFLIKSAAKRKDPFKIPINIGISSASKSALTFFTKELTISESSFSEIKGVKFKSCNFIMLILQRYDADIKKKKPF
jgi:hypothetical protein